MPFINVNGRAEYVPGVYGTTKVISSLPGPLPEFHIPVILASAPDGHPYDQRDTAWDSEGTVYPWKRCNTTSILADYYGRESEAHRASKFAWRHGLPFAYMVNLAPITRATHILYSGGAAEQVDIASRKYGAPNNALKWSYNATTDTFTLIVPRYYAMVAATVTAGDTRVYVTGKHDWLKVGATVKLADNAQAPVDVTIAAVGEELDSNKQRVYWFEASSAIASGVAIGEYPLVWVENTESPIIGTGLTTPQEVIDWINTDPAAKEWLVAKQHASFDNSDLVSEANSYLGWTTTDSAPTSATSPAASNTELADFVADMNAGMWAEFAVSTQTLPRAYYLGFSDGTMHGTMRDYAVAERTRGYPISITTGCGWGDIVVGAGDSTDPTFRAAALNNQDVHLCANGLDKEGAHLSMAAAVFGLLVSGGVRHNLTNDGLIYEEFETSWDEINSGQLTALLKSGVITNKLSIGTAGNTYRLAQGLNTLQANSGPEWSEVDSTTYFIMQRDLADFVDRVVRQDFETYLVGADELNVSVVAGVLKRRVEKSLEARGYVTTFTINSVAENSAGTGYDLDWGVRFPKTGDYFNVTTNILIGS